MAEPLAMDSHYQLRWVCQLEYRQMFHVKHWGAMDGREKLTLAGVGVVFCTISFVRFEKRLLGAACPKGWLDGAVAAEPLTNCRFVDNMRGMSTKSRKTHSIEITVLMAVLAKMAHLKAHVS